MPEHVLIVGPGRDFPGRLRAAAPGTETTVICQVDFLGKVRDPGRNARVLGARGDAPEEWVALAAAAHAQHPFTRIATFGERDQDHYAAIAEALGLPAHSPGTVELVHDKGRMRERLREAGIDSTASARVADVAGLLAFVRAHGLPCVVKPVSSSGSAGVTKVSAESELAEAFARADGSYLGLGHSGVLVEEYLEGPQYSVEAFSEAGEHQVVGITLKYSDPVGFVELGHVSPAPLAPGQAEGVHAYVGQVLDALGVATGPTHSEIVLTAKGPRLIETHVRMGGDQIPVITREATGVDIDDCAVRQTLGEPVLPGIRAALAAGGEARSAAVWFGALATGGVLDGVSGLAEAGELPGVTEVAVLAKPGAEVGGLQHSESRVAYARAVGRTPEEAVAAARAAVARLEFTVRARCEAGPTV